MGEYTITIKCAKQGCQNKLQLALREDWTGSIELFKVSNVFCPDHCPKRKIAAKNLITIKCAGRHCQNKLALGLRDGWTGRIKLSKGFHIVCSNTACKKER
jgi:hypothetical protein